LAFEQLKRKLTAEGLFEQERKRPLPPAQSVKRIAIVTSPTGAAIHDMITVLKRRWPMIEVNVYPTAVQGKDAPQQIINALARANRDAANNPDQAADVVIVGRGGGSLEDLWSFNDEAVARAIVASTLPVISAVGHEVDFTIADFVADVRAPTPSAAAEIISPDGSQLLKHVRDYQQRLVRTQRDVLTHQRRQLNQLTSRLRSPQQLLQTQAQRLDQLEIRLQRAMQLRTHEPSEKLLRLKQALEHMHPQKGLDQHQRQLTQLSERIQRAMNLGLETKKKELISGVRLLNSVSPLEVLSRGYSITQTNDGSVIHNAQEVKSGDTLETRLHSGKVISTVTDVHHD
jgi:exodeoxyribonuclease VII large subunit